MAGGRRLRIVAIGGGTGLSTLLRGLKSHPVDITAIVTASDDGGSSGKLRGQLGVPPPGDIRNCLVALAEAEPLMQELFQYRFPAGSELGGHSLGNLLLAALTQLTGDFEQAVALCSGVLKIRGQVLPATRDPVVLGAELQDGSVVRGETVVTTCGPRVRRLFLEPAGAEPLPQALEALEAADAIVLGPGSLYTSVIPPLLVEGLRQAVCRTQALRIYVCNVMTQPGETDGYSASRHVEVLFGQVGAQVADVAVVNVQRPHPDLLVRYRVQGAQPVVADPEVMRSMGLRVVKGRLLQEGDWVRHHPERLARVVVGLAGGAQRRRLWQN
ncbi:MAG: uridine diphosphate-N-acetylglucosamine-binding protein YvcK [Bacillota bacterium]